jgi:predicted HicB family RNase H-like nuclease
MKRRDDQITLRVAGQLRAALEDEAAAESRGLSNLIRKILIGHVAQRIAERTSKAA